MKDTRIPEMIFKWKMEGRRRTGRQPMSWKQKIHQTMRNPNITTEDAHGEGSSPGPGF